MSSPRILVAGIGNIFLGDDAFGSEVARRLMGHSLAQGVTVVDFGIRGIDLTYALLDGYDAAILVDATTRGGPPGTLYVIEPEPTEVDSSSFDAPFFEAHSLDPAKVLRLASALGPATKRVLLVGCEPETFGTDDDPVMGLSPAVDAAVDEAIRLIESLAAKILAECRDVLHVTQPS